MRKREQIFLVICISSLTIFIFSSVCESRFIPIERGKGGTVGAKSDGIVTSGLPKPKERREKEYDDEGNLLVENIFVTAGENYSLTTYEYYKNGNLKLEEFSINGLKDGVRRVYYEDGQLKNEEIYHLNRLSGYKKDFYPTGKLSQWLNYRNGKQDGLQRTYYQNGQIKTKEQYSNGVLNGPVKEYYEDGNVKFSGQYRQGNKKGQHQLFYPNNKIKSEEFYNNDGQLHGVITHYFEDGTVTTQAHMKNGRLDGVKQEYFENGNLQKEEHYQHGRLEGIAREYFESGALKIDSDYHNDRLHSYLRIYAKSGELMEEYIYKDGNIQKDWATYFRNTVYKDDELLEEYSFTKHDKFDDVRLEEKKRAYEKIIMRTTYADDSQKLTEETLTDGLPTNITHYNEDVQVIMEEEFEDGFLTLIRKYDPVDEEIIYEKHFAKDWVEVPFRQSFIEHAYEKYAVINKKQFGDEWENYVSFYYELFENYLPDRKFVLARINFN